MQPEAKTAYIGLGANLGDARQTVLSAVQAMAELPDTQLVAQSGLYASHPVEADGPDYVNAVVSLRTGLSASALLGALQAIEQRFHRTRSYRNAPRTLDLDLLLYGDDRIDTPTLTVPHPRMHQRAFVLVPLAEIAPEVSVAPHGTARELLAAVANQAVRPLAP